MVSPSPTTSELEWHRSLDFSATAVATDGMGNVYVTGFAPFGSSTETGRSVAMVLEKATADGMVEWSHEWRSAAKSYPDAAGWDIAVSPDGGVVYVAGSIMLPPWEVQRPRLWAYSPGGALRWTQSVPAASAAAAGRAGVVLGGADALALVEPDSTPVWTKRFLEPEGRHCDAPEDVALGEGDAIYAVGYLDLTPTCGEIEGGAFQDSDVVIQKRSRSGEVLWSRILTDPETDNDRAIAIDVADPGVFVVGVRDGRAWLTRLTPDGRTLWDRVWGGVGTVYPVDVSVARGGAIYVLANRRSPGTDTGPLILQRYTPHGDLEMDRRLRQHGAASASGVATGSTGGLYVTAGDFQAIGDVWRTAV